MKLRIRTHEKHIPALIALACGILGGYYHSMGEIYKGVVDVVTLGEFLKIGAAFLFVVASSYAFRRMLKPHLALLTVDILLNMLIGIALGLKLIAFGNIPALIILIVGFLMFIVGPFKGMLGMSFLGMLLMLYGYATGLVFFS